MVKTVTLPLWLAAAAGLLTAWVLIFKILLPGLRWFLKRREESFVRKISRRLNLTFPAIKFARKRTVVERLLSNPDVLKAIDDSALQLKMPSTEVAKIAEGYAREIVPSFHAYAYYLLGRFLGIFLSRLLYRVRVGYVDEEGLSLIKPSSSVVFLMNHRSNMDYLLLGYLTMNRAALSFAVGEWARAWPIKPLVKAMGAYFVRRQSGNILYRRVLASYVTFVTQGGLVQAVYPEGKLSRDGKLHEPKVGILDYMLRGFDPDGERDVVFVPVGINYDRVLEDRTLISEDDPAVRKGQLQAFLTTLSFIGRNFWLMVRGGWHRFGYAVACFGQPVSMKAYANAHNLDFRKISKDERADRIHCLAGYLFERVGRSIPASPVSMVSLVFLKDPGAVRSKTEIKALTQDLMAQLEKKGAYVYIPRHDRDYAVEVGLRMLTLRRIVSKEEGGFRTLPEQIKILTYYANSISHLLNPE
jgi:glycerol-3-phosphate O-acyltransferase